MDWNMPTRIAAVLTAVITIGGAAWAFGDNTGYRPWLKKEQDQFTAKQFQMVMDQAEQNTLAIVKNEFSYLQDKLKYGELTFEEKESRCKAAQILDYKTVDGCTPKTGEPDFTITSPVK